MSPSPSEPAVIRQATAADDAAWQRMRQALWPDCPPERHALETRLFQESDAVVFIAEKSGETCGFIELSTRRDPVEGTAASPTPYVEGWFVDEHARGKNVGQLLLQQAESWARARGFRELASDAEIQNPDAIRAHLACGFREVGRNVCFVKPLES